MTSLTEINVYDDLDYDGFVLITLGVGGIVAAGITAKSGSNVAAFAANTALLYGNPTLKTTGTSTKSFDLDYFYFGCVLATEETALSTPTACTVDIAGYDSKGKKAKSQSFHFKPTGAVKSNMVQAKVTGWTQLSKVTFSNAANLTEATLLDNFSYTVRG